jgi:fumarate hydratase class II
MKAKVIEDADDATYVVVCDPGDEAFDSLTQRQTGCGLPAVWQIGSGTQSNMT